MKPSPHAQAGVMLLEVLVAVVVLSLGLLGLVGLQARAMQYSASAEDTNRAALLANEIAAEVWTTQTGILPAAFVAAWEDRVAEPTRDGLPNGRGTYTVNGTVAEIVITWRAPNATESTENRYTTQVVLP